MAFWKTLVSAVAGTDEVPVKPRAVVSRFENEQKLVEGFLWGEHMILPRQCAIKDLSPLTAQVILWETDIKASLLTGKLKLYSCLDRKEADCIAVKRDGKFLHLRFESSFHAPSRKYE